MQDLCSSRTSLTLENERGSAIEMEPFRVYTITTKPTMQFYSKTKTCEPNSQEHCVDECIATSHQEICVCVPWTLHHLNSSAELCTAPCLEARNPEICASQCERLLEHPCALSLYQFETVSRAMPRHIQPDRPFFELEIRKIKAFNHPHFIEVYAMSLGDFIAQLGGLMEFWVGLNIIGILHIIVFAIKQIIYVRQPDSNAAKTLAQLFGKHNEVTERKQSQKYEYGNDLLNVQLERKFQLLSAQIEKQISDKHVKMEIEIRNAIMKDLKK